VRNKIFPEFIKRIECHGRKSEEVHTYPFFSRHRFFFAVDFAYDALSFIIDFQIFDDGIETAVFYRTHAAGNGTAFAHRVAEHIADHRVGAAVVCDPRKIGADRFKSRPPVVVVGVDDGKGRGDRIFCAEYGVHRTPRFFTVYRQSLFFFGKQTVVSLKNICCIEIARNAVEQPFAEIVFDIFSDNVNDFTEARFPCIVRRVVEQAFVVQPHCVDLFDPAVSASHSRRKNQ